MSRLLTTLLTSSIPAHRVKSIIRSDSQTSAIKLLAPNPDLDLVTPIVLSLEKSPVSEFTQVFEGADVVFFVAGAGGKAGENGEAADERTKTVDYEGAVKVFDAVEKVQGGGKNVKKPRLILVSYMDIHRDNAIPSYYVSKGRPASEGHLRKKGFCILAYFAERRRPQSGEGDAGSDTALHAVEVRSGQGVGEAEGQVRMDDPPAWRPLG